MNITNYKIGVTLLPLLSLSFGERAKARGLMCVRFILFMLLLFSIPSGGPDAAFAQNSNTFMRMAGAPGMNGGLSLAETSDGGFVGTGQQEDGSAGSCDVYVYKVDACGTLEWEKLYGGPDSDGGKYVQQTSDGGYIVTGIYGPGILLLKLDAAGTIQWARNYSATYGLYVQQTSDGGYILSGVLGGGLGGNDIVLIKTDANGVTQWKKVYGGAGDDWGDYVEETSDGGFLVAGLTSSYGAGSYDLFLLKTDSFGAMLWNHTYGGSGADGNSSWGISGQVTSDGGYMVCGNTSSYGAGSNDVLLIKTDNVGSLQWAKTYGGADDDQPRFAHQTRNGGYIICGLTRSFGFGDLDAYLIKTDVSGNLKWSKAYGGALYDKAEMVREADDGGYALSIISQNFGANYFDPIFMKTDSLGVVGCHEANCATIVNNVTPSVGTGFLEAVPASVDLSVNLSTHNYTPGDVFLCQHCNTIPSFVPSDTIACVGETVLFYNTTSVGKVCNEDWYINNTLVTGDKDTLPFIFNTPGVHLIQLIAACANTTDTNTIRIHVFDVPAAAFSSTSVCNGDSTKFTDNSTIATGSITSRTWDFDDGSPLSTAVNPSHKYLNAGIYHVILIVKNSVGCADTITKPVQVYYNPSAGFTFTNVCQGDSLHFVNTSSVDFSTSIASYSWGFGDGSAVSNLKNPAHYYSSHGTFTTVLITTTIDGCSDTASSNIVKVFDPPASVFTFSNICLFDSALFTNASQNPTMGSIAGWSWNFGDGSPLNTTAWNPGHMYAVPGNYTVTLITRSSNLACPDTLKDTVTASPIPAADFVFNNVCLNQAINFYDSSYVSSGNIAVRSWSFGDGTPLNTTQNPSHTYAAPGTYNVSLTVTTNNGCKDTITKSVVVHPRSSVYFNALDVCDRNTVYFSNFTTILPTDTIHSLVWNLGDGSPISNSFNVTHIYDTAGSYIVKLIVVSNFGCSDSITKTVIVHPNPISNFGNTSVCQSASTVFSDSSTTALGTISTWSWSFGDGSPLNSASNPSHLYAGAGIKTVTLIVKNSFGCKDTAVKPVQVYYNPIAGFKHSNVCLRDSMNFIDTSSIHSSTSIASYLWVFGDNGSTSSLQSPSHYYSNAGIYNVTLVTLSIDGCSSASIVPVKTFDAPVSHFTFSNTCLFNAALFTNTSVNPAMGSTASWSWNFGDGSALNTTAWSLAHLYAAPGKYQLTLITHSSNLGCPDTLKDSVTVFPMPFADYSFTDVCLNQVMNFYDSSTVSSGIIAGRLWSFGDGTLPNANPNPNHQFANPGIYSVSLIATTDNGCKDTIIKSVKVHPMPDVRYSALNVCDGSTVHFNDSSSILFTDTLQSWTWNFGDGSPVINNQNSSHLYSAKGSYSVKLLVVSNFGCMDSITKITIVNPNPEVAFTANDTIGCEPLCVSFQNTSSIASGFNAGRIWNFGDGSAAGSSLNPVHCYNTNSVYLPEYFNVLLTVTSDSGCVSALSKNNYITVYPNPNAIFAVQPQTATIIDPVISINDLSTGVNYWSWNFGDIDTSYLAAPPPHTYGDTGIYKITLITATQYGCLDTAYQTIIIEPDFVFYIPNAFTPDGDGLNDSFFGKGVFISTYEMSIYDRWGNLIFFSNDINKAWDGKANHGNEIAVGDVYIYSFKITDFKSGRHNFKGIVTLVR